jgi:hypothetical protein
MGHQIGRSTRYDARMADATYPTDRPVGAVCPWCSAALTPDATVCPSCGANLTTDGDPEVPGLTAVDQAVVRGEKKPAGRNRLLSWISGEYPEDEPLVSDAQALAPPDADVQREITRLALEAEVANLQAEADAMMSEAAIEGRVVDLPKGVQPFPTDTATPDPAMPDAAATPDAAVTPDTATTPAEPAAPVADTDTDTPTQADPPA